MKFQKLRDTATLPTYGSKEAGGLDLYVAESTNLLKGINIIPTGLAVEIPEGYVGLLLPRSSMNKRGLVLLTGVIDSDYRGEVMGLVACTGIARLDQGVRFAQLVLIPCYQPEIEEAATLSNTDRGSAGFGSTGE